MPSPNCSCTRAFNALLEIIRRGELTTILPGAITTEQRELRALTLTPPLPQRTVAMLYRRDSYRSAAANAFAALVHDWLPPA
jgi:LysR family cyn operon transcriptional activator